MLVVISSHWFQERTKRGSSLLKSNVDCNKWHFDRFRNPCLFDCNKWHFHRFVNQCLSSLLDLLLQDSFVKLRLYRERVGSMTRRNSQDHPGSLVEPGGKYDLTDLGESTKPNNKTWSTSIESSIFGNIMEGVDLWWTSLLKQHNSRWCRSFFPLSPGFITVREEEKRNQNICRCFFSKIKRTIPKTGMWINPGKAKD
jgi:hypothetical protein